MSLLVNDLSFQYAGGKTVLDGQSLTLTDGMRIALVGDNGAGKSTLLGLCAGRLAPDGGTVQFADSQSFGLLSQEPELDFAMTVQETTERALADWHADLETHATLCAEGKEDDAHMMRIANLTERIELRGGFAPEQRADEVLTRLSLPHRDAKVSALSGGERRRLDLARLLLEAPDVLLLDEPTNHLDRAAVMFLGATLKAHRGPVLFISHDRAFLDDVATEIVELSRGVLFHHPPPYGNYIERRMVREETEARTHHRRQRILAREVAWMRAGVKARTTKQKARQGRAESLIAEVGDEVRALRERKIDMTRAGSKRLGKTILEIDDLSIGHGDRTFFSGMSLKVVGGERWGIIGQNGAGKTTFFKTLMGEHEPRQGAVKLGKNTKIGLLDQHRRDLREDFTVKDYLCPDGGDHVFVGEERIHVATFMEKFMFDPADRLRPITTLSGGEQNRLHLAKLLSRGDNVLFLDEPTNDLDVTTLGILEETLHNHEGAAFIISHDRVFLDRVVTGIIAFEPDPHAAAEHRVEIVQGDYTHYLRTEAERQKRSFDAPAPVEKAPPAAVKTKRSEKRKRTYKEQQAYERIEAEVFDAEARKEEVEALLADGSLFRDDNARATALTAELSELGPRIEKLFARWQELEDLTG